MNSVGKTHCGIVRKINQDNFLNQYNKNGITIIAVADGLGGHKAGEVASRFAVDELAVYFNTWEDENYLRSAEAIKEHIRDINRHIYDMANKNADYAGMGTTLTLLITNGREGLILHIGDSRAYKITARSMTQLTKDHSLVQFMLDQGQITPQQAERHPQRNIITRALGTEDTCEIDTYTFDVRQHNKFLVCSDGLTNCVSDRQIAGIIRGNEIGTAADLLIDAANENGGADNITVVLYEAAL